MLPPDAVEWVQVMLIFQGKLAAQESAAMG